MPSATFKPHTRNSHRCNGSQTHGSAHVLRPYRTPHQRIDRFLRELMYLLPICSQVERERLWFTLQEIFSVPQFIYTVSPQLPQFLIRNRQQRNLRRITLVVSHLPQYHHPF